MGGELMSNIRQLVGKNVRRYREARNLTQEMLADMVDVSGSYIGYIERGQQSPSLKLLEKISVALEVHPDNLLENPEVISEEERELKKLELLLTNKGPAVIRFMQETATAYFKSLKSYHMFQDLG